MSRRRNFGSMLESRLSNSEPAADRGGRSDASSSPELVHAVTSTSRSGRAAPKFDTGARDATLTLLIFGFCYLRIETLSSRCSLRPPRVLHTSHSRTHRQTVPHDGLSRMALWHAARHGQDVRDRPQTTGALSGLAAVGLHLATEQQELDVAPPPSNAGRQTCVGPADA